MIRNTLIKLSSIGFAGTVVYGTYNFIQKNEKIFNLLTGNNKLKNINSDVDHKDINNSTSYELKNAIDISDNVQKQTLSENSLITNNVIMNTTPTSINTVNSTSNGIDITTKKSEQETTSISNNITVNEPQNSTNATNNTSNEIEVTIKKPEQKVVSNIVTISKPQVLKKRRLSQREKSRRYGSLSSLN